jgi:hypothetical protein
MEFGSLHSGKMRWSCLHGRYALKAVNPFCIQPRNTDVTGRICTTDPLNKLSRFFLNGENIFIGHINKPVWQKYGIELF